VYWRLNSAVDRCLLSSRFSDVNDDRLWFIRRDLDLHNLGDRQESSVELWAESACCIRLQVAQALVPGCEKDSVSIQPAISVAVYLQPVANRELIEQTRVDRCPDWATHCTKRKQLASTVKGGARSIATITPDDPGSYRAESW
jgi:hypothetical protein